MKPSHRAGLRWLRTSILLTLGLSPLAACQGTIVIDCSDSRPSADGLVECGPVKVRPDPAVCTLPGPGNQDACGAYAQCKADSDCTNGAIGRCGYDPEVGDCGCTYVCQTDSDCNAGQACFCGEGGGQCVEASCRTSADCAEGQSCALYDYLAMCGVTRVFGFACTSDHDECLADSQCSEGLECVSDVDHFVCTSTMCAEGRPFYIEGELRTAPVVATADWASLLRPDVNNLAPTERAAMARRWSRIGQLEHASVASFARFALQLLSLGAPPELVEQTTSAMADESLHARLAFGLASAYAGSPVGPGNLDVGGAMASSDVVTIVRTLIHEGCVGETLAAVLAREERERTTDPVVRGVLDRIIADESEHALLAWRALGWLVEKSGSPAEAAATLKAEMAALASEVRASREVRAAREGAGLEASPEDGDGGAAGALTGSEMASLRVLVLETVVLPSARALLERAAIGAPRENDPRESFAPPRAVTMIV